MISFYSRRHIKDAEVLEHSEQRAESKVLMDATHSEFAWAGASTVAFATCT